MWPRIVDWSWAGGLLMLSLVGGCMEMGEFHHHEPSRHGAAAEDAGDLWWGEGELVHEHAHPPLPWEEGFGEGAEASPSGEYMSIQAALSSNVFQCPLASCAQVTQGVGATGVAPYHTAVDLAAPAGQAVFAPATGVVKHNAWHTGYGGVVMIEHNFGGEIVTTLLGHLDCGPCSVGQACSKTTVSVGQTVQKGAVVGYIGAKGTCTNGGWGAHLHWGLRKGPYSNGTDACGKWNYAGYTCLQVVQQHWLNPLQYTAASGGGCGSPPSWWCGCINDLKNKGILDQSNQCSNFDTCDQYNRATFATMVGRAIKLDQSPGWGKCSNPYSDVPANAWYASWVVTLSRLKYSDTTTVFDTGSGKFNPDNKLNRCEMAKIVAEAWNLPTSSINLPFSDAAQIPSWCVPYVKSALAAGVISTASSTFRPADIATVGELACVVSQALSAKGVPNIKASDFVGCTSCSPSCSGKSCGPNGCGGSCGSCSGNQACNETGQCVSLCDPQCAGKQCGGDGCGGSCGSCGSGMQCNANGQCQSTCTPNCSGKQCGSNGCGGSCGTCSSGLQCNANGQCQSTCAPNCSGKQCGSDGCGGSCGTCSSGLQCNANGQCQSTCTPNCSGKQCGSNGCGGSCGTCATGSTCSASGQCVTGSCAGSCGSQAAAGCWCDAECVQFNDCCSDYQQHCASCTPNCNGKQCGPNGCGGSCGSCAAGSFCTAGGQCEQSCTPKCSGKQCGPNGCGGSCGSCAAGSFCTASGQCEQSCAPQCSGKQCGPNGCGGSCGSCAAGSFCTASGQCEQSCAPQCSGKQCGPDGCGGSCGSCASGTFCNASGQCEQSCTPQCSGKQCGPDGCGGSCGNCPPGASCESNGKCASSGGGCEPKCGGKTCGDDGCGGVCGQCSNGQVCVQGVCEQGSCATKCSGKECGPDGCGGTCGLCPQGSSCTSLGTCALDKSDPPSTPPGNAPAPGNDACVPQYTIACIGQALSRIDLTCGAAPETLTQCPEQCSNGQCVAATTGASPGGCSQSSSGKMPHGVAVMALMAMLWGARRRTKISPH